MHITENTRERYAASKRLGEICGEHTDLVYIIGAEEFIAVIDSNAAARKRGFGRKSLRKLALKIQEGGFNVFQTVPQL